MKHSRQFFNRLLRATCMLIVMVITTKQTDAQISLTAGPYVQDFNSLVNSGTSTVLPAGWLLSESGTNANATYTAGTGSGNAGDSYSFGPAGNSDRALGGLLSGSLTPLFGAGFINNSGSTIISVTISYTGEQWRIGALGRVDRLNFEYSDNATSLTSGAWNAVTNLNFTAPNTTSTVGALDGNSALNRTIISFTLNSLSIANGASFYIRWTDFNATSADDGLAVDDFSLSFNVSAPSPVITCPGNITVNSAPGSCGATVTFADPVVTGGTAIQTCGLPSGSFFPVGTTLICFEVNGYPSVNCSFTITVNDNIPPVALCNSSATVNLDNSGNGLLNVSQVNNGSSDNCSIAAMTLSQSLFTCADIGTPVNVILTVTDSSGLTNTCASNVTVQDLLPPVAVCQNATVILDASGNGTLSAAQVNNGSTDNCGIAGMTVTPNTFNCSNVSTAPAPTDLFISEYIEGTANNKCIEIYNGTAAPVNLGTGGYALRFYFNGSVSVGLSIPLTGTVAAGDVYVVCQSSAAAAFLAQADQTNGSGWYNGDDAIELVKTGVAIDLIGSIGFDPGSEWGSGLVSTADNTLRRKPNVTSGVPSNPASFPGLALEWDGYATDNFSNLGAHAAALGNVVTLTVTDFNGLSTSCTANVTVIDNLPPTAVCQNATVLLDANGNGSITANQINNGSTDNCGIATMTVSPNTFTCADIGSPVTVTLTVTDVNGLVSTCSSTVTVVDDLPPVALCQNVTVNLDATGNGSVTTSQIDNGSSDNCGIASISISQSTFNCSDISGGSAPADLFFSEYIEGSSNNKCIEIFNGTGSSVNLTAGGYQVKFYFNGSASAGLTINLTGNLAPGDVYVVCNASAGPAFLAQADLTNGSGWYNGDDAVVLVKNSGSLVLDIFGRIGEDPGAEWGTGLLSTADQTLRRNSNIVSGVIANPVSGFPTLATEWTGFVQDDATGLGSHSIAGGSGSGVVPVTLTVTDVNGNISTCQASVTVVDNAPPTVICQDITVSLDANGIAAITAAQIDTGSYDACGIAGYTVSPSTFNCGNIGTNIVTLTVTDINGNSASCVAIVTIVDDAAPLVNCQNVTVVLDAGGNGTLSAAQVNNGFADNCGIASMTLSQTSFTCADIGTGTVPAELFISEYIEGSSFNKCIEIYNGTSSPVDLSANSYQLRIYFNGSASSTNINLTGVIAPGQVHVVCHTSAASAFQAQADQLTGSLSFNGDDAVSLYNGNLGIDADIFGRVGEDPGIAWVSGSSQTSDRTLRRKTSVLSGVSVNPLGGFPTLGGEWDVFATDNSAGLGSHNIISGSNVVTLTVTDNSGNSASCNAVVNVIDNIAPQITCPANISVGNDPGLCGSLVNYSTPVGTDVCYPVTTQIAGLPSGSVFPIGTTVNTFSVEDAGGNIVSCSFSVTVIDTENPTIVNCPSAFSSCNPVTWTAPLITDNCPGVQITSTHTPGSNFPFGTTTVTYTATDAYNNVSTCSFDVTRMEESVAADNITSNRDFNNICLGDDITLTINGGSLGEAAQWKWFSGSCGGTALPAFNGMASITVSPAVTTTYYARAEGLCNTTSCISITVVVSTAAPNGVVITSAPAIGAVGQTGVVTANIVPGATFYRWTSILGHINAIWFNGSVGPVETATNSVNVFFQLQLQNYQIRVVAGNACGRSNNASAHIRGTVPAATCLTGAVLACPSTTATYSVAGCPIPGTSSYQWTIPSGDATITAGQGTNTISVTFGPGFTTAQVCVNGVSTFGLAGPTTCLTVSNSTEAPGAITGNDEPCQSGLENYTIAPVTGAVSYIWTTNIAGATASGTTVTGTVQFPSGSFSGQVCVQAVSGCGTSVASCYNVTSGAAGIPGPISGPVSGICGASNVNYALATNDANSYNWILPAGVSLVSGGTTNSVNVSFATGLVGPLTITVEAFYNCGSATESIVVDGAPATPTITPATICAGTDELYFASSAGADNYTWALTGADYEECTNGNCSQYYVIWNVAGGTMSVTATNSCGTSAPFNLSTNCRVSTTGNMDTKVYPNPTSGNLTIEFTSYAGGQYNLTITDMAGRSFMTGDVKATSGLNQHSIDLGTANPGLYMLYLKDANGDISVHKITVE